VAGLVAKLHVNTQYFNGTLHNRFNCRSQIGLTTYPTLATYTITLAFHSKRMTTIIRVSRMNSANFHNLTVGTGKVYHPSLRPLPTNNYSLPAKNIMILVGKIQRKQQFS